MRNLGLLTLSAAILSFALALGAAPNAAEAGRACKRAGLPNYCAKSSDIFPNITLGKRGNDGDVKLKTNSGSVGIKLDGNSGNVTNRFVNTAGSSNGLVKAWAAINSTGTISACWRCNMSAAQTQRIGVGQYEVDFTPLSTNISGRPRAAVIDDHSGGGVLGGTVALADRFGDPSTVFVGISNNLVSIDRAFTLIIY